VHRRHEVRLAPAHVPRRPLDPSRQRENDDHERGKDRERDEREPPVEVEHQAAHPDQQHRVIQRVEETRRDRALDCVDVGGDRADDVAGALPVVIRHRQALRVCVDPAPQLVRYSLTERRDALFLEVARRRGSDGDEKHGTRGELEHHHGVGRDCRAERLDHGPGQRFRVKDRIEHDLDRPRLEQRRCRLNTDRREAEQESSPVTGEQSRDRRAIRPSIGPNRLLIDFHYYPSR